MPLTMALGPIDVSRDAGVRIDLGLVSDETVMPDVGVAQDEAVPSDDGRGFGLGAAVDGGHLADDGAVADLQVGTGARLKVEVLRQMPQHGVGVDLHVLTNVHPTADVGIGIDPASGADADVALDHRVGTDLHVLADLRFFADDGPGVDCHDGIIAVLRCVSYSSGNREWALREHEVTVWLRPKQ